jgi:hypothetical protein
MVIGFWAINGQLLHLVGWKGYWSAANVICNNSHAIDSSTVGHEMTLPSLFSDFRRSDGHIHGEGKLAIVTHSGAGFNRWGRLYCYCGRCRRDTGRMSLLEASYALLIFAFFSRRLRTVSTTLKILSLAKISRYHPIVFANRLQEICVEK